MKDFYYITIKLLKKHNITLMLLLVVMVMFFINIFNHSLVLAKKQVAEISCSVDIYNNGEAENVCFNNAVVTSGEQASFDFNGVKLTLRADSILEIDYDIKNIDDSSTLLTMQLNRNDFVNFKIQVFVNGVLDDTDFTYLLAKDEVLNIKIVLSIENIAKDACLSGSFNLTVQ